MLTCFLDFVKNFSSQFSAFFDSSLKVQILVALFLYFWCYYLLFSIFCISSFVNSVTSIISSNGKFFSKSFFAICRLFFFAPSISPFFSSVLFLHILIHLLYLIPTNLSCLLNIVLLHLL